jgi:hypothetical protein
MQLKSLMTLAQFQDEFAMSRSATYREIGARRLRLTKIGRASRIAATDAQSWLALKRASSQTDA